MAAEVNRHAAADSRSEIVIFHNHPRNILNHVFDNQPLASNTDRKALENSFRGLRANQARCSLLSVAIHRAPV
jgi:hypothetical protein